MSGEDFIYSTITNDNMNTFDLNIIANTIVNTDKLVRQNKQQKEENALLREKISSLRESALQIKTLYETEVAKVVRAEAELASYVSQCKQLEERCLEADSDKINADLILMERLAERDRQVEENERRYRLAITDLIRYISLPGDPTDAGKKRELKQLLATLDSLNLPDDVKAFLQQTPYHRSKRRKGRTKTDTVKDQECQTSVKEMRNSTSNTEQSHLVRPEVRDCGTDALEVPHLPKEQSVGKTFCDKATMHSMSTITRATCTSVFIKRVDVGVNFPEVTLKSVDEILRECVPLPPLLLSPITDVLPIYESVSTQTDPPVVSVEKSIYVTCGTMTNLKNVRKRIDYRAIDASTLSFQQQYTSMAEQLFGKIKQEDYPSSPSFNFGVDDTFGNNMDPHFSVSWRLLGEQLFVLMNNGRRFDNQFYNMVYEQFTAIRNMLEADGRRESEQMSAMFSNARATVVTATGNGKERGTTTMISNAAPSTEPPRRSVPEEGSEFPIPADESGLMIVDSAVPRENRQMCTSSTKELSNNDAVVLVEPEIISSSSPEQQVTQSVVDGSCLEVAQSIESNGMEAVSEKSSNENEEQPGTISPSPSGMTFSVLDEEVDRIEQQLQMMEEGDGKLPIFVTSKRVSETPVIDADASHHQTFDNPAESTSCRLENMLQVASVPESESECATPEEEDEEEEKETIYSVPRPSTPPAVVNVTSCYSTNTTATFLSPIKVKETNQLVKDQFKTPTQLPISKRKLRARPSADKSILPHASKRMRFVTHPNPGRTSPTSEFLLEDDWDQKFSSIKAHMIVGPLKEGHCAPLSPITDRFEAFVHLELEKENNLLLDTKQQATTQLIKVSNSQDNSSMDIETYPVTSITSTVDGNGEDKGAADSSDETKDTTSSEESNSSQQEPEGGSNSTTPIESRSGEGNTQQESNEGNELPERKLPLKRRLSEEIDAQPEAIGPTKTESIVENVPVNMDTSSQDDTDGEIDSVVQPSALEDGEIAEDLYDSSSSIGELVIDIDPIWKDDCTEWDSPMSPPAHETGLSVSTQSTCHATDSPLSPPLPSDREATASVTPVQIPLFHAALHSQLRQQMHDRNEPIYAFIALHRSKNGQDSTQKHTNQINAKEQKVVKAVSEILAQYLQRPDWTETVVNETIAAVLNCTQDVRLMTLAMLEMVVSCADTTVNVLCSPPAPPLPLVQQKLILIVRHLGYGLEALEPVLMRELDRRMFQLKGETLPLPGLIALTFLYIGLEDSKPSEFPWKREYTVRLYIFKCLYYFGFKGLPLVYYVLRAFPFALPKKGSPHYDNSDAMIATIRTILMNVSYTDGCVGSPESALFRKRELLWLLKNTYGYQQGSPTYEELVVNLVEKIRANKLRNVAHSLILVAKRNGFDWARLHIIQKRIYPLLNEYLKQFELVRGNSSSTGCPSTSSSSKETVGSLDDRIVTCIFTIASIMKTQPSNEDASRVMQIFTTIVQLAEGNRAIQEEAIAGLIKFSRFGYVDVFQRLSSWDPGYPISDRMKLMLMTMVHRKPPRFWKQLMQNRIV